MRCRGMLEGGGNGPFDVIVRGTVFLGQGEVSLRGVVAALRALFDRHCDGICTDMRRTSVRLHEVLPFLSPLAEGDSLLRPPFAGGPK